MKLLLPFPPTYLAEGSLRAGSDLLLMKRSSLDITKRGNLRLKLIKSVPNVEPLHNRHGAQGPLNLFLFTYFTSLLYVLKFHLLASYEMIHMYFNVLFSSFLSLYYQ